MNSFKKHGEIFDIKEHGLLSFKDTLKKFRNFKNILVFSLILAVFGIGSNYVIAASISPAAPDSSTTVVSQDVSAVNQTPAVTPTTAPTAQTRAVDPAAQGTVVAIQQEIANMQSVLNQNKSACANTIAQFQQSQQVNLQQQAQTQARLQAAAANPSLVDPLAIQSLQSQISWHTDSIAQAQQAILATNNVCTANQSQLQMYIDYMKNLTTQLSTVQ